MKTVAYLACVALVALASCTDYTSATNLNPEGPPMIRQVRLKDNFADASGSTKEAKIFAFGTHPNAVRADGTPDPDQQHQANAASALSNSLRVIMDEILIGNNLEEVECRATVDNDVFARVPLGATPQDIANCSTPRDVLARTCVGDNRVCVCEREQGCVVSGTMVPQGGAVGILDANEDGAADNTRFIQGSVAIVCGGVDVPVDLDLSYWTPSGDQNVPAMGGFDVLGPAIVLTPAGALRTNSDCSLRFDDSVVDKENQRVCAPVNGDIDLGCEPGDVSAFRFKVQPLVLTSSADGTTMAPRTDNIIIESNVPVAPASTGFITVTANGAAFTDFTVTLFNMDRAYIVTPGGTGFPANANIVITFPVTVTDAAGAPLPAPVTISFMTGAT